MKKLLTSISLLSFLLMVSQKAWAQDKVEYGTIGRSGLNWANYVMVDKGFLAKENIESGFVIAGSSSRTVQYLAGGSLRIADAGPDAAILAIEKGAALTFVAANVWVPPFRLVARPEIKAVEELRGKKIGASAIKTGEVVMTKKILKAHGIKEGDYEIILVGGTPERYAALSKGAIDGTALSQPFDFLALAEGLKGFDHVSDVLKDYQFQVTMVDISWAKANRDLLVRYLRAKVLAHRWLWDPANKQETIKILVKNTRIKDPDAAKTYDLWFGEKRPIVPRNGEINVKGLELVLEDMADSDLLKRPLPKADRYVNLTYYNEALASFR